MLTDGDCSQQAHRERKKKLMEELWIEIHSLRNQNTVLQKQLQTKTELLEKACHRLRLERYKAQV